MRNADASPRTPGCQHQLRQLSLAQTNYPGISGCHSLIMTSQVNDIKHGAVSLTFWVIYWAWGGFCFSGHSSLAAACIASWLASREGRTALSADELDACGIHPAFVAVRTRIARHEIILHSQRELLAQDLGMQVAEGRRTQRTRSPHHLMRPLRTRSRPASQADPSCGHTCRICCTYRTHST